eukprot:12752231-Prorocentrum_lima.AAC.1
MEAHQQRQTPSQTHRERRHQNPERDASTTKACPTQNYLPTVHTAEWKSNKMLTLRHNCCP